MFVESDTGREVFFHGINSIVKGYPWVADTRQFSTDVSLTEEDWDIVQGLGMNVNRLG